MITTNAVLKSKLQVIHNLKFPKLTDSGTTKLKFNIPQDVDSFSFHVYYHIDLRNTFGKITLKLKGPNNLRIPSSGYPFLYSKNLFIGPNDLDKGYEAITVPPIESHMVNIAGDWQAYLIYTEHSNVKSENLEVRICHKTLPSTSNFKFDKYEVPVKLWLVSNTSRAEYRSILEKAMIYLCESIYKPAGIEMTCNLDSVIIDTKDVTSDIWNDKTKRLILDKSNKDELNVFLVDQMKIIPDGALGFSMLPGPQGFSSLYNGIFVKLRYTNFDDRNPSYIAKRIGHEIGHYLGLIHDSSCLDTVCTSEQCTDALKNRNELISRKINGNLMYSGRPGIRLNKDQRFMLRKAPIITVVSPKAQIHPITRLRVRVKTGAKYYYWWFIDDAGTQDLVDFMIGNINNYESQELNQSTRDFIPNQNKWFTINPRRLNVEDIKSFYIGKSLLNRQHHYNGYDKWLLEEIEIEINNVSVFTEKNINVWLHSNDDGPNIWEKEIPQQNLKQLLI